jgi:cytochrome P450
MTRDAPGPAGLPLFGNLFDFGGGDRLTSMVRLRQQYGDIVRLRIMGRTLHIVSHPDDIKYVLQDNNRNYVKGRALGKAKVFLGEGLLTSEGELWRRQRRLAQPAFHRQHIERFAATMTDATADLLQRWEPLAKAGQPINVADQMMRLTLDIVSRTLFSTGLTAAEIDSVAAAMPFILRETDRRIRAPLEIREHLPLPSNRRFQTNLRTLDAIVYRIIADRRRLGGDRDDLLGLLMAARDEETGAAMDDKQLRDEAMTIFLAGHETTANNLAWTWTLLSQHPDGRRRLQAELDQVLRGRTPDAADMPRLIYTRMVLDESLRLYPPAWAIARQTTMPDQVGGYDIPANSGIIMSSYVVHRHPAFWCNAEAFDPERFAPERIKTQHRYAYFPFGGGPRLCIGNSFALMESTLILAMISQRYDLNLWEGHPVVPETAFTLRPLQGVMVTLHVR